MRAEQRALIIKGHSGNQKFDGSVAYSLTGLLVVLSLLWPIQSDARFIREGETVLYGRSDTIFKVCNKAQRTLYLALVYRNVWKFGEDPTWPAKGWFQVDRGGCHSIAVNGLLGVMSVMYKDSAGDLLPHYGSGKTALADAQVGEGQSKKIKTEYLCVGNAPFSGYKNRYREYYDCASDGVKVPFQILFNAYGNRSYTLSIN